MAVRKRIRRFFSNALANLVVEVILGFILLPVFWVLDCFPDGMLTVAIVVFITASVIAVFVWSAKHPEVGDEDRCANCGNLLVGRRRSHCPHCGVPAAEACRPHRWRSCRGCGYLMNDPKGYDRCPECGEIVRPFSIKPPAGEE